MKANEFFKAMGLKAVKQFLENDNIRTKEMSDELKRLVESHELTEKVGGLDVCKKIMFQKRLRQPKATHVLQHHENKKLIQFFSTNQSKPNGSVMLDAIEQAIADVESCQ